MDITKPWIKDVYIGERKVATIEGSVEATEICSFLQALGFKNVYYKSWCSIC